MTPNTPWSGRSIRFRIFNPHRLSSDDLRQTFVARRPLFDAVMRDIAAHKTQSVPQHHLVVGQRGMGKTTLLQRIAVELLTQPLQERFLPLTFPEEQYVEVDRLSKFWLNCLDAAADTLEREGNEAVAEELDATIRRLEALQADETTLAEESFAAFRTLWKQLKRRPVLLIDNFNLLLSRLRDSDYNLRGCFSSRGGPILVAASTIYPDRTEDYGAAFYEGFKPHILHPLSLSELQDVFRHLAALLDRPGLSERIIAERPRLAALRDLTGGNPRTAVLLFELFVDGFSEDAYEDLDALLDVVTPLYQSRLDQLSEQAQVIAGTLARNWAPLTRAQIAAAAGLNPNSLPAQLGRLRDIGLVEEADVFPHKKPGYQISERFFNIWYLMRFTTRRQRSGLACLARFLEEYHTPAERLRSARELMGREQLSAGNIRYAMALAQSIEGMPEALELDRRAQLELLRSTEGIRARIAELLDPDDIEERVYEFAELQRRLADVVPADAAIQPGEFRQLVLSSPALVPGGSRRDNSADRNSIAQANLTAGEIAEICEQLSKERSVLVSEYGEEATEWIEERLRNHTLSSWDDVRDVECLITALSTQAQAKLVRQFAGHKAKTQLSDQAFARFVEVLDVQPESEAPAWMWNDWGVELADEFGRYSAAESAYREAIRLDPADAYPWNNLGNLLQDHLSRYEESESAYREAIRLDPGFAYPWNGLGNLLKYHLGRFAESESVYREAIRLDPEFAAPWNGLGNLLQAHLGRYEESESAYREAIRLGPGFAAPWNGLGNLLQAHLGRYEESESAYREAIRLDPVNAYPWNNLGNLLKYHLSRYEESESAYREAIRLDRESAYPWNGLGNLYADYLDRDEDAEDCYRRALALQPRYTFAKHNLVFLLRDRLNRSDDAERMLAEIDSNTDLADTRHLHAALFAAYKNDWDKAAGSIQAALAETNGRLPPSTRDDWFRASAVLLHLGFAHELVTLLRQHRADITLMPWFAAVEAHAAGDRRHLVNIPVEAREAAGKIYDEIDRRRQRLPDATRRPQRGVTG